MLAIRHVIRHVKLSLRKSVDELDDHNKQSVKANFQIFPMLVDNTMIYYT